MKKRILTVIGARPQIIKAAAISRAVSQLYDDRMEESILHTGQHYDENMSRVFFSELGIPAEAYNLGVGSGDHGAQTAMMLSGIEKILKESRPDGLLIYGDTNSTLAGALAASKLHIPVFHVEAGLRSFDKTMPEEINRVVADHVSTVLFAPTDTAVRNLAAEGIISHDVAVNTPDRPLVVKTGDVMYDNALYYRSLAAGKGSRDQPFILATIHRDHNTDHPERLRKLLDALGQVAAMYSQPVLLPLHPRTAKCIAALEADGWKTPATIQILKPVSYLEMIALESSCSLVITDSGGVQKEAFFFRKPCIILRPHTEWVEIVEGGNATIAGDDTQKILMAAENYLKHTPDTWPEIFGDGHAAEKIVEVILKTI
jgi:UDP-GlcNAc3NAcA epimerase